MHSEPLLSTSDAQSKHRPPRQMQDANCQEHPASLSDLASSDCNQPSRHWHVHSSRHAGLYTSRAWSSSGLSGRSSKLAADAYMELPATCAVSSPSPLASDKDGSGSSASCPSDTCVTHRGEAGFCTLSSCKASLNGGWSSSVACYGTANASWRGLAGLASCCAPGHRPGRESAALRGGPAARAQSRAAVRPALPSLGPLSRRLHGCWRAWCPLHPHRLPRTACRPAAAWRGPQCRPALKLCCEGAAP